jgi:hypothetical protein
MKTANFIFPSCILILAGCSSLPSVPSKDAGDFISAISAPSVTRIEKIEEWLQPVNKEEACLLIFWANDGEKWWGGPNEKILWDGECRDGYAYGLGREFYEGSGGLISTLVEYKGGRAPPVNYYQANYDGNYYTLGEKAGVRFEIYQTSPISYAAMRFSGSSGENSYVVIDNIHGDSYAIKKFVSGYKVVFSGYGHPASPLKSKVAVLKDGVPVKYVIDSFRNGVVNHADVSGTPKLVKLPENYLDFLGMTYREILFNVERGQAVAQEADLAINRYKRRVCAGDVVFEGIDSKIYGKICLPNGDVDGYLAEISVAREEVDKRYAAIVAEQQAAANRIATQNAAIRNKSINDISDQLRDFSSDMQDFSNSMNSYNIQNSNKAYQGGGAFGSGGNTYKTNCYQSANIISCKTR